MDTHLRFWITVLSALLLVIYVLVRSAGSTNPKVRERRPTVAFSFLLYAAVSFGLYVLLQAIGDGTAGGFVKDDSLLLLRWSAGAAAILAAIVMLYHIENVSVFQNSATRAFLIAFWLGPFLIRLTVDGGLHGTLINLKATPFLQRDNESLILPMVLIFYHFTFWSVLFNYVGQLWRVGRQQDRVEGFAPESIDRTVFIFSFGLALFIAMLMSGTDFISLGIFSGILAAGLSVALRELLNNLAAGMILLLDESVKVGNVIELEDGTTGKITEMTMRYTLVQDRENRETLIPNSVLVTHEIRSYSHGSPNVRLGVEYPIALDADVEKALASAVEACLTVTRVVKNPKRRPRAFLQEYKEWAAILNVRFWISDPEEGLRNVRSEVLRAVTAAFRGQGIQTPHPIYSVKFEPEDVGATAAAGASPDPILER